MRWLQSRQNPDGSFVNLMSTTIVLPSLIGALPYDVQNIACPKNITGEQCRAKNPFTLKAARDQNGENLILRHTEIEVTTFLFMENGFPPISVLETKTTENSGNKCHPPPPISFAKSPPIIGPPEN